MNVKSTESTNPPGFDELMNHGDGVLEVDNAVVASHDAWNAAIEEAIKTISNCDPKAHDSLISKPNALSVLEDLKV